MDFLSGAVSFLSTQLAGNLITLFAALVASLVFVNQNRHANHVRDLTFIANQQQVLAAMARAIVAPDKAAEYDVAVLLATMEQTAHAFNSRLVGPIAVDYLRPEFIKLLEWSMHNPSIAGRWRVHEGVGYVHLRRFMAEMGTSPALMMAELAPKIPSRGAAPKTAP